jgi:hypothetical protein
MNDDDDDLFDGPSLEASLEELKVIYRVLRAHAVQTTDLDGNVFYENLADLLRLQARSEGVDTDAPSEWEAWLVQVDEEEEPEPTREVLN